MPELKLKLITCRIELLKYTRKLGKKPTLEQQLSLQERRRRLQAKIDTFTRRAPEYLGAINDAPIETVDEAWFDEDLEDKQDDIVPTNSTAADIPIVDFENPEQQSIPLPSSFGEARCRGPLARIAKIELRLREGQANDALHLLRVAIAKKSFTYRTKIRGNAPTSNYSKRLRSYGDARAIQMSIDHAAKVYMTARKAMVTIGSAEVLNRFHILKKEDLVASTAVAQSNARGQRKDKLSWIWRTTVEGKPESAFISESGFWSFAPCCCSMLYHSLSCELA